MIPESPSIISRLKLLLPSTLPKAASVYPFEADIRLTNNSGADVPKETIVRPMARLEILYFFAIEEDPLTRKSAPLTRITNPATRSRLSNNIDRIVGNRLTINLSSFSLFETHTDTKMGLFFCGMSQNPFWSVVLVITILKELIQIPKT